MSMRDKQEFLNINEEDAQYEDGLLSKEYGHEVESGEIKPRLVIRKRRIFIYVYKALNGDSWFEYEDQSGSLDFGGKLYCDFVNDNDGCKAYKITNEQNFLADNLDDILE